MILPKPVKMIIGVFRGDVAPLFVLLSVMLGFWFGLMPDFYGIHVAILILALILNIHFGVFLMAAAFGKAVCFAAAPVLFHVGVWAQANGSAVLEVLANIPIVGITDFSRYAVAGALLIGPVVGLLLGIVPTRAIVTFRRNWLRLDEGSEAFRRWRAKGWVRFLDRWVVGKSVADVRAAMRRRPKLIRVPGVILAVVLLAGSAVGAHLLQKAGLTEVAGTSLTQVNGAEVNLENLHLALAEGRLSGKGIEMTDPDRPTHNRVAIGSITADFNLYGLLLGRLVMDEIELSGVELDQPRAKAGTVLDRDRRSERGGMSFDFSSLNLKDLDPRSLESYVKDARQVREWLDTVRKYLPDKRVGSESEEVPVPESYLAHLRARAPGSPTPRFVIRRLVLNDVVVPVEQIGKSNIVCMNLSDAPWGLADPLTIAIESLDRPASVKIACDYSSPDPGARIEADLPEVNLRELQEQLNGNNPVVFDGGTASARVSGRATRDQIDLSIAVKTKGMKARSGGGGAFGLDPQVTSEAMKVMENLETTLRLVGPITEPRLVFDSPALTEEMKTALVRAGKDQLAGRIDGLVGKKMPPGLPDPSEALEKPQDAAKDTLGGLLGGKKVAGKEEDKDK